MNWRKVILRVLLLTGAAAVMPAVAQSTKEQVYALVNGSELVDDCPMCGRPTILAPLSGTFTLRLLDQNPLYVRYQVTNISFHADAQTGTKYTVSGSGVYQIG